ncbi:winged helix-turn-helix transcriptional regulator [Flexivirga sp. ID2601S]|uniref:Winged helix-turn-helix transcriptional regulator n=1 Tax=Flexivirga aerilata TaxID=1656889 RepID=A0A849ADT7_9MICO|nr:winged helix-turn-helix transcriptional regulator [Flexivirga aerilata]
MDAARLWSVTFRLGQQVVANAAPDLRALGLDPKELFVLAAIEDQPYPAAIAADLLMPKATVAAHLKKLQAEGYVDREIDPGDLRRHRLRLTAKGQQVTAEGMALVTAEFGERLGRLTGPQQEEFAKLVAKLV